MSFCLLVCVCICMCVARGLVRTCPYLLPRARLFVHVCVWAMASHVCAIVRVCARLRGYARVFLRGRARIFLRRCARVYLRECVLMCLCACVIVFVCLCVLVSAIVCVVMYPHYRECVDYSHFSISFLNEGFSKYFLIALFVIV